MKKTAVSFALMLLFCGAAGDYALAEHRGSIRRGTTIRREIEIRDYDAVRMQREAIAAQEEARREEGRKIRREEIERELQQRQEEYLDSQEAIRQASFAARNAPRGFFYRKPGTRTPRLPAEAREISVGERKYFYYQGVYYRKEPGDFVVVTAPAGALTPELPDGYSTVRVNGLTYFYYFGSFYRKEGNGFTVTAPVDGATVSYLPDGYLTEETERGREYRFGGIRYRPFYQEGILVYAVQGI